MLDQSLAAFAARDAPRAREVCRDAMQIDALRKRVFGELLAGMLQEPSATAQIRRVIRISRCLERIAEGAVAIAAMVVRMVEVRDAPLAVR
jgi:phosphate uptake regulator